VRFVKLRHNRNFFVSFSVRFQRILLTILPVLTDLPVLTEKWRTVCIFIYTDHT